MPSNLDHYKNDLERLIRMGYNLDLAMRAQTLPEQFKSSLKRSDPKLSNTKVQEIIDKLPSFRATYQAWYSEAKSLIRQLLPDRLSDFAALYERPKTRKALTNESYTIEDYLLGLEVSRTHGMQTESIAGPIAAIPKFQQQLAILESVKARFESSLFDIRQLVQGDLFDSELEAAEELVKNKFERAAGAVAGVVLERHLAQVCNNHQVKLSKKDPGISNLNDTLKSASVIEVPQWRFIQHLADIRNLCDHNGTREPTAEQVGDLIDGVKKISKTLF
jgi:hypothetical protein